MRRNSLIHEKGHTVVAHFLIPGFGCQGSKHWHLEPSLLLHQLNLTRSPGFVEPGLGWTIESQQTEPAFFWNRLDPVRFFTIGGLGTEVEIN